MRPRRWLIASAVLVGTTALLVQPSADARSATGGAAGRAVYRGVITFVKNYDRPDDSRLTWSLRKRERKGGKGGKGGKVAWVEVDSGSWRAGSGMGGRRGTNSCIHNVGWLPDGTYRVRQYANYPGQLIRGRAFRLDDKRCAHGVTRHNLFIHTEQDSGNRQCRNRPGDQPCRWEFPRIDDYHSAGCIKMSPGDLRALVTHYRKQFRTGVRYAKRTVELRVVTPDAAGDAPLQG